MPGKSLEGHLPLSLSLAVEGVPPLLLATWVIWERWSSVAFVSISDVFLVPKMLPSTCTTARNAVRIQQPAPRTRFDSH
jgi:hypothetical protein